ncbi:hypothetical protein EG856_01780 [Mycoplasmopsis phocirhinis]|uniref:Uncharacterized protein n=1 Tax=Mycoplasmopsis phocirhinis TaxID=142650 RepID=A0A4P6MTH3_9BACT|nr:hypothetical protein [Mycoplasmopsis phocirhinis]QBF34647.1 hypothetical protein EG856_01780 [Mycoplasmopsis phocirhinis]
MSTFLIVVLTYFAISLTISSVLEFYFVAKRIKELNHIKNHKLKAKPHLISKIKLPENIFNIFDKFFKKTFALGYILIAYLLVYLFSYLIVQSIIAYVYKINLIKEEFLTLFSPLFSLILSFRSAWILFKKNRQIKAQIKQWKTENNESLLDKSVEMPQEYFAFKKIILSHDFDIKLLGSHNFAKVSKKISFAELKSKFYVDNKFNKDQFIYFMLFDYSKIQINNNSYDANYYVYLIKDIINNEF